MTVTAGARRLWAGLALALLVCAIALPAAADPKFPALTGRVVDDAGVLSDTTEAQLTSWLAGFEQDNKKQVVVATVKSLQDTPIEDYGVGLLRAWGIGEKGKNTGAILLIAPNDRQLRIEVGYGLEGELTDAISSAIINQQIVPAFKQGDIDGGVTNGTAAILQTLGWKGAAPTAQPVGGPGPDGGSDWGGLLYFGFIFIFLILRGLFGRRRPGLWGTSSSGWGGGGFGSGGFGGGGFGGGGFSGGGGSGGGGGASGRW